MKIVIEKFLACAVITTLCSCGSGGNNSGSGTTPVPPPVLSSGIHLLAGALGGYGTIDGVGTNARLMDTYSITIDPAGNALLNRGTRKVAVDGTVTTPALGNGALVYDTAGNAYGWEVNALWKIDTAGIKTYLAGSISPYDVGSADGQGSAARFSARIGGIAVDLNGNIYVTDSDANTIRKVTPSGMVTTVAGSPNASGSSDGIGGNALFWGPGPVTTDAAGNIYVGDIGNITIRKITPTGTVTTLAGSPQQGGYVDGVGANARMGWVGTLVADNNGNLYFSTNTYCTIRKVTPDGTVSTLAGSPGQCGYQEGTGANARFYYTMQIGFNSQTKSIYAIDQVSPVLRKIGMDGTTSVVAGNPYHPGTADGTGSQARFGGTGRIVADAAGDLYVADALGVRKTTPQGVVSTLPYGANNDNCGNAIAIDTASNLYVACATYYPAQQTYSIIKIAPDGTVSQVTAAYGITTQNMTVDSTGNLFMADSSNTKIRKISPSGNVSDIASFVPLRMISDSTGNIYTMNFALTPPSGYGYGLSIKKISPSGAITTVYQSECTTAVCSAANPDTWYPTDFTLDSSGNVYVSDVATVRKITPAGVVSIVAGQLDSYGVVLGALPGSLGAVSGIAIVPGQNGSNLALMSEYSELLIVQ